MAYPISYPTRVSDFQLPLPISGASTLSILFPAAFLTFPLSHCFVTFVLLDIQPVSQYLDSTGYDQRPMWFLRACGSWLWWHNIPEYRGHRQWCQSYAGTPTNQFLVSLAKVSMEGWNVVNRMYWLACCLAGLPGLDMSWNLNCASIVLVGNIWDS